MKSTGLFGKNSGRVGGVVYSNYRGQQIVRAYQPSVKNANSKLQIAQRAKFKLVSQIGASLRKELELSYLPSNTTETPRNSWMSRMLRKTVYANGEASLPIEDVVLTNSSVSALSNVTGSGGTVQGVINTNWQGAKVRVVRLGYNVGGEITVLDSEEASVVPNENGSSTFLTVGLTDVRGFTNIRALVYAYMPDEHATASYEDYQMTEEEAVLSDVRRIFSRNVLFSETVNILLPQSV